MLHFESMCLCFNDRNGKKKYFRVFSSLLSSVPSNSAHMKTEILSHSFSCGYEKQVVCFKLFFFCYCLQSIFFRPYNITVSLTPKRRRKKRAKYMWRLICICKCENFKKLNVLSFGSDVAAAVDFFFDRKAIATK